MHRVVGAIYPLLGRSDFDTALHAADRAALPAGLSMP